MKEQTLICTVLYLNATHKSSLCLQKYLKNKNPVQHVKFAMEDLIDQINHFYFITLFIIFTEICHHEHRC